MLSSKVIAKKPTHLFLLWNQIESFLDFFKTFDGKIYSQLHKPCTGLKKWSSHLNLLITNSHINFRIWLLTHQLRDDLRLQDAQNLIWFEKHFSQKLTCFCFKTDHGKGLILTSRTHWLLARLHESISKLVKFSMIHKLSELQQVFN